MVIRRVLPDENLTLSPPNWFEEGFECNWPATLAQHHHCMITDNDGSYAFFQDYAGDLEGHLFIAEHNRGAKGYQIAREMLVWIAKEKPHRLLRAKTQERSTGLFLRRIGFNLGPVVVVNQQTYQSYHWMGF